jgi:hypothetical protein
MGSGLPKDVKKNIQAFIGSKLKVKAQGFGDRSQNVGLRTEC